MSPVIPSSAHFPVFPGNREIRFSEKPVPEPGPGQLLLKINANALCGSERSQFFRGTEVTPGHEAAGTVVKSGAATRTAVGTNGVVFLMDFCGTCRSCRLGYTNQCLNKRGDMGFNRDGGYGPYELVNEQIFFPVDADLVPAETTLLLDIMGTGGHAIERSQQMRPDISSLLILGSGPIGLGVLGMAKLILGSNLPVFVTDIVPFRLELAEKLGGVSINARNQKIDSSLNAHGLTDVDIAIDTTGKQAARQEAIKLISKRGSLICVGHGESVDLDVTQDLITPERGVIGSEYFRYNELPANLERLRRNLPFLRQIITHRFGVKDIQKAFELFFQGETGKVIIEQ